MELTVVFRPFFLLSLQRSLKVRSWMLQKLLSLKLLRNRSYRQCLKRSMKPLNCLQETLSGMLTVSFVFAMLFSFVGSWEFGGATWNSEIPSGKGGLKPGIYGRNCSEGHFQMCHSSLFPGAQPSVSVRCLLKPVRVWWLCSEVHVHASLSVLLLNWFLETGKYLQKCSRWTWGELGPRALCGVCSMDMNNISDYFRLSLNY